VESLPDEIEEPPMWNFAEWTQTAPGLTPLIALIAVLVAWRQLVLNRINQRETTAKTTFREYLRLAVQYPELSTTEYDQLKGDDLERYKWLVGYLLWSAEELIEFRSREDVWTRNLHMLIGYHREYLKSQEFREQELGTYSAKMQALINNVIK
jgi:hypothetical protein